MRRVSISISRSRAGVAGSAASVSISFWSAAIGSSKSRVSGIVRKRRPRRSRTCGDPNPSSQLHGPCADHLLDVRNQLRRRLDANLRADLHLHADPVRALAGLDLERYLAIAAMARKDLS